MLRSIEIPRTPEVVQIERRAAVRFLLRYFGWGSWFFLGLGLVVTVATPLLIFFSICASVGIIRCLVANSKLALEQDGSLWWLRIAGWVSILVNAACLAVAFLWFETKWEQVACVAVGLTGLSWIAFGIGLWWVPDRQESEELPKEVVLSDVGLTVCQGDDQATFPWKDFYYLWQFPDCWILVPSMRKGIPVPTFLLDDEIRDYMVEKVSRMGDEVRVNPGLGLGLMFYERAF